MCSIFFLKFQAPSLSLTWILLFWILFMNHKYLEQKTPHPVSVVIHILVWTFVTKSLLHNLVKISFPSPTSPARVSKLNGGGKSVVMHSEADIQLRKFELLISLCSQLALLKYPAVEPLNWLQSKVLQHIFLNYQWSLPVFQKQVQANVCVNMEMVKDALDQLRGAVMIVYPMGLPPHDPVRMEFEDKEDLSGTHVCSNVFGLYVVLGLNMCYTVLHFINPNRSVILWLFSFAWQILFDIFVW